MVATEAFLVELAVASLQVAFSAMREAGLTPEEQKVLYDKTDADYISVSGKPQPSVDGG